MEKEKGETNRGRKRGKAITFTNEQTVMWNKMRQTNNRVNTGGGVGRKQRGTERRETYCAYKTQATPLNIESMSQ